jgi:Family of unknown function (DUF6687)
VSPRGPDLHYVPYAELTASGTPNVVVDGSPTSGTVLCLSHWPGISSPAEFADDLSAQMAFRYLRAFDRHSAAEAVSNNHFDQDGLVGVFAVSAPDEALARCDLLVEVARAGDFAVTTSRDAARVSMAISAYADPARSPLPGLPADYDELTAVLYAEMLGRLPELCDHPARARALWAEEDATLDASEAAIASGAVHIEEVPDLDLAVVSVPAGAPYAGGHRFGGEWRAGLHHIAVYNATERGALLTVREQPDDVDEHDEPDGLDGADGADGADEVDGWHYEFAYRYESWVQFRTRHVRPRVDLTSLAERLNDAEADAAGSATWEADDVSGLTPALAPAGAAASTLAPATVRELVEAHLRSAPPAWDPYRLAP